MTKFVLHWIFTIKTRIGIFTGGQILWVKRYTKLDYFKSVKLQKKSLPNNFWRKALLDAENGPSCFSELFLFLPLINGHSMNMQKSVSTYLVPLKNVMVSKVYWALKNHLDLGFLSSLFLLLSMLYRCDRIIYSVLIEKINIYVLFRL